MVEHDVGKDRDPVGDNHLLEKSHREDRQSHGQIVGVGTKDITAAELRQHLAVMNNWAGDQLGKERDEQAVVDETVLGAPAGVGINQVGDLLKREERDRQWKHDGRDFGAGSGQFRETLGEEAGILEIAQQTQVRHHAHQQQPATNRLRKRWAIQEPSNQVVESNGTGQQDQVARVPGGVECERGDNQPTQRNFR